MKHVKTLILHPMYVNCCGRRSSREPQECSSSALQLVLLQAAAAERSTAGADWSPEL